MIRTITLLAAIVAASTVLAGQGGPAKRGVLLLAHGGAASWNERVQAVAATVDLTLPVETALGMAARGSIEGALNRLASRGVTDVVAVPLFVSSWSSVIRSTEYLLGLRDTAPADLALFAKMDHSMHGSGHAACVAPCDATAPLAMTLPVRMTAALNRHPLVGAILADRARSVSTTPAAEAVVLVAHGPVPDEDNRLWLADMQALTEHVRGAAPFAAVHAITVRDDAGPELREHATRELRALVEGERRQGRRVLVVPHLLSFGGIEQGVRKRLEGLEYAMPDQALIPDPRIAEWVLAQASAPSGGGVR
jgi:sirohydrochlorin ferrochelatase